MENGDGRGWEIATAARFGYKVKFYKKMSKNTPGNDSVFFKFASLDSTKRPYMAGEGIHRL